MHTLRLRLSLEQDLALPARNSMGGKADVRWVQGSMLLGAVAASAYRRLAPDVAFRVFHSGAVRFSNAYPAVHDELALPTAASLRVKRDDAEEGYNLARCEAPDDVRLERPASTFLAGRVQRSADVRSTLRTAIDPDTGRVREGLLFGIEALAAGTVLYATVDADDGSDLDLVRDALLDRPVHLGRSRSAEFGRVKIEAVEEVSPQVSLLATPAVDGDLVCWLASDLALIDATTGSPRLIPEAADLELGGDWMFDAARSHLLTRRYAPFHGYRRRFDDERQVIAAGSVVVFRGGPTIDLDALRRRIEGGIGLFRQEGLGRVVVEPQALEEASFEPIVFQPQPVIVNAPDTPLIRWLRSQVEREEDRRMADSVVREHAKAMVCFRVSPAQWGELAARAARVGRAGGSHDDLTAAMDQLTRVGVASLDGRWGTARRGQTAAQALTEVVKVLATESPPLWASVEALARQVQRLEIQWRTTEDSA